MGLNYNGNKGGKGIKISNQRKSALEYLSSDGYISAHKLRIKLISDGIKEHKCEICNLTEWNSEKIPLELHHIDGNRYNNDIVNIQILCPNCHSQTENNSGKNKGNY
jgi:Zn finger protein HypA/HybF involved in hydrogenase expression